MPVFNFKDPSERSLCSYQPQPVYFSLPCYVRTAMLPFAVSKPINFYFFFPVNYYSNAVYITSDAALEVSKHSVFAVLMCLVCLSGLYTVSSISNKRAGSGPGPLTLDPCYRLQGLEGCFSANSPQHDPSSMDNPGEFKDG